MKVEELQAGQKFTFHGLGDRVYMKVDPFPKYDFRDDNIAQVAEEPSETNNVATTMFWSKEDFGLNGYPNIKELIND